MSAFKLILFIIFAQAFSLHLINGVEDIALQYDLLIANYLGVALLASIGWFRSIDYNNLKAKAAIFFEIMWLLSELIAFALSFTKLGDSYSFIRACALSAWFYYILYRTYNIPKEKINNRDIFAVRTRPDDLQGFLISLISVYPLGGYGLLYKGNYYHFRHGILVKDSSKLIESKKHKFVVIKSKKYDTQTINKIEQLVGTKWSLTNNCFTVIRPLLKNRNDKSKRRNLF